MKSCKIKKYLNTAGLPVAPIPPYPTVVLIFTLHEWKRVVRNNKKNSGNSTSSSPTWGQGELAPKMGIFRTTQLQGVSC